MAAQYIYYSSLDSFPLTIYLRDGWGWDFREAVQLAGGKEWVELYLNTHGARACTLTLHSADIHPPLT